MRYELKPGNLVPEVLYGLHGVPPVPVMEDEDRLAHPADIFVSVFRNLIESGILLCQDHQSALVAEEGVDKEQIDLRLRRSLRGFHTCLADYVNACRTISKTVAGSDKAARAFRTNAGEYYDQVMTLDNFVKHRHRPLRTVYARWPKGQIIGYQIEAAIGEGAVGAEPKIHRYPGTAFSINRALAYHTCSIFFMAAALRNTLQIPVSTTDAKEDGALHKPLDRFLELVSQVPRLYFPDEMRLPVPLVKKRSDGGYVVECPSSSKPQNRRPHVMDMTFVTHYSPHAPRLEVPYLGTCRPWEQ